MKKFLYIFLVILVVSFFTSCKKDPIYHKIKYEIVFEETPNFGSSNYLDVRAIPCYPDTEENNYRGEPNISPEVASTGYWSYEYWELTSGQGVMFKVSAQLSYVFQMRVYVDGVEVSYMRVSVSDDSYMDYTILEKSGLNNYDGGIPVIEFTYYE